MKFLLYTFWDKCLNSFKKYLNKKKFVMQISVDYIFAIKTLTHMTNGYYAEVRTFLRIVWCFLAVAND